jgi:hypothetical protein
MAAASAQDTRRLLPLCDADFEDATAQGSGAASWLPWTREALRRAKRAGHALQAEVSARQRAVRFSLVAKHFNKALPSAVHLAIEVTHHSFDVALRVAPLPARSRDFRNLRARLFDADGAAQLAAAIANLPAAFSVGPAGETRPARALTVNLLRRMVERVEFAGLPLWIGLSLSKDAALQSASTLGIRMQDALISLAAIGNLIVHRQGNDFLREPQRVAVARSRLHSGARVRRHERDEAAQENLPLSVREPVHCEAQADPLVAAEFARTTQATADLTRMLKFLKPRAPLGAVDPKLPVERGLMVQVLSGPFTGVCGIVEHVERDEVRVRLGILAQSFALGDVVGIRPRAKRTALGTSHLKRSSG